MSRNAYLPVIMEAAIGITAASAYLGIVYLVMELAVVLVAYWVFRLPER